MQSGPSIQLTPLFLSVLPSPPLPSPSGPYAYLDEPTLLAPFPPPPARPLRLPQAPLLAALQVQLPNPERPSHRTLQRWLVCGEGEGQFWGGEADFEVRCPIIHGHPSRKTTSTEPPTSAGRCWCGEGRGWNLDLLPAYLNPFLGRCRYYVQNAAPDGPVAWLLAQVPDRWLR